MHRNTCFSHECRCIHINIDFQALCVKNEASVRVPWTCFLSDGQQRARLHWLQKSKSHCTQVHQKNDPTYWFIFGFIFIPTSVTWTDLKSRDGAGKPPKLLLPLQKSASVSLLTFCKPLLTLWQQSQTLMIACWITSIYFNQTEKTSQRYYNNTCGTNK